MTFNTGDTVRLKGGKVIMVVQRHDNPLAGLSIETLADPTPCIWHDSDGRLQKDVFAATVLELVEAAKP